MSQQEWTLKMLYKVQSQAQKAMWYMSPIIGNIQNW